MSGREDIRVTLARIETKLDAVLADGDDYEVRLRTLERARWPLPSLAVLISAGALLLAALRPGV